MNGPLTHWTARRVGDRPGMAHWSLVLALALLLTSIGCGPTGGSKPGPGEAADRELRPAASAPPLRGRIESFPGARSVLATIKDIADGATVSLIRAEGGLTMSTAVSSSDGTFNLAFPPGFIPVPGQPYFLEAVKGLKVGANSNRAGAAIARVRTVVVYQGGWTSVTGSGIVIGRASTAVAIVAGHRDLGQADLLALIGKVSGTSFAAGDTAIPAGEFERVFALVTDALAEDQDPVETIGYFSGGSSPDARYARRSGSVVVNRGLDPPVPARGATVNLTGQNFPAPGPATPSFYIGRTLVQDWSLDDTRGKLTLTVPPDAVCGYLRMVQGPTTWYGPVIPVAGTTGTLAGGNGAGNREGRADKALFDSPRGVVLDGEGNLLVSEVLGSRMKRISWNGQVSAFVGNGTKGTTDGQGLGARLHTPCNITLDRDGNVIVADVGSGRVRKVTPAGETSTLTRRGTFEPNPADYWYDDTPVSVAVDAAGDLYIGTLYLIWKVSGGAVSPWVGQATSYGATDGTGAAAKVAGVTSLNWAADGYLYAANSRDGYVHVKRIASGGSTATLQRDGTFVANGSDRASWAGWWAAPGPDGTLYSAFEWYVHKAVPGTGLVAVAGATGVPGGKSGTLGFTDGPNATAKVGWPMAATIDASGVIYYADVENHAIRAIAP